MRSAEDYLVDVCNKYAMSLNEREDLARVLNKSRKDCIEECYQNAEANYEVSQGGYIEPYVDKQSILSLIDELK